MANLALVLLQVLSLHLLQFLIKPYDVLAVADCLELHEEEFAGALA
jgi:hypothetical protein